MARWPFVSGFLVLALSFAMAACSGGNAPQLTAASEIADNAVAAATAGARTDQADVVAGPKGATPSGATPTTVASAATEAPTLPALISPSDALQAYRVTASFAITSASADGAARVETAAINGAWVRTAGPFGFDAAFELSGSSGDKRQDFSFTVVGNDAAIRTGEQWTTIARTKDMPYSNPNSLLVMPFMPYVKHGENLGRETVAGIETSHYRITDPTEFATVMAGIFTPRDGAVQSIVLEGWVGDGGYVVKYALQANVSGVATVDGKGNETKADEYVSANYVLSDVNGLTAIAWPDGAPPPGSVSIPGFELNTFPLPDGATVAPALGVVEIAAPQSEEDVTAFYQEQLSALGWTVAGDYGFYTATNGEQTISLNVTADPAGKGTHVEVYAGGQ